MGDNKSRSCEPACAARIRDTAVGQLAEEQEPSVELLHAIASEIANHCGHSVFKSYRLAWGWTVAQAVEQFHQMCRRENLAQRGLVVRSWMEWEAGARPSWDYQDLLSRLFSTNPVQLGWAPDYAPPARRPPPHSADKGLLSARTLMQLPPDIDVFTGHDEELTRLRSLLDGPPTTAVTIAAVSGTAGVGKTALAVHVAHQVHHAYPDGQLYVDLGGTGTKPAGAGDVLAGFLREFGVENTDIPEGLGERTRMYRGCLAGHRVLVVLDNAVDETQLRPLLPGNAGCAVLVTSRTPLATLGGLHLPVDVLPEAEAIDLISAVIGADRAHAEPDAVRIVARLCGGLPLALRIAGARLVSRPSWTVSWFAERLADESRRLDLLAVGDLEVRASFGLSYHSRSGEEQTAFRMLALTAATFPAWNLATLLDTDLHQAEQLLENLVDAQLVEIAGIDTTGAVRYRLHDLIRDFARECSTHHDTDDARRHPARRLIDDYTTAVHTAASILHPGTHPEITDHTAEGTDRAATAADIARTNPRRWFIIEQANIVAAVQLAHRLGLWEQTWQLAATLPTMFDWRADWQAWAHTHELALDAAREIAADGNAEAVILRSLGALYRELGRFEEAATMLTRAAALFRRLNDHRRWAATMKLIGDTRRYQGRLDDALDAFSASLLTAQSESDDRSVAGVLNGLGDTSRGLSRFAEASRYFTESLAIYRDLGDELDAARTRVRYGLVHRDQWNNDQALHMFEQALPVFEEYDDQRWQARTLRHIAVVHRNTGNLEPALSAFEESLSLFDRLADRRGTAVTLRNRGDSYRLADNHAHAVADLTRALEIFESITDHRWIARCHLSLTDLNRTIGNYDQAHQHLDTACDIIYRTSGDSPAQARAQRQLGMLCRDCGDYDTATTALVDAHALFTNLGDQLWIARAHASLARLAQRRGQDPEPEMKEALAICHRRGITAPDSIEMVLKEW
ncbi:tetratricopeptide repeat protein [Nocardia sp. 2YAB30]|uniref:ATP-binding protein n=1 Tax=unclassified Nocardia TaxID=2637762 RepID=UPI003F9A4260